MSTVDVTSSTTDQKYEIAHLKLVPKRHIGRMIAAAIVRAFSVGQIEWSYVRDFLFAPAILDGLKSTLIMTVAAMALGIVLGVVIAIMRVSGNPVLSSIAIGYVWIFRGAPALLQLMIWFNLALIFPTMGIPGLFEFRTVDIMTPFVAAMLGLGISQGAYTSEVVRSGLLSVDSGQYEAARAIGMTQFKMLRRIVLPQAMRGAADRKRGDRHGQADFACQRHPVFGDPPQRPDHLLRQYPRARTASGRVLLVPRRRHSSVDRPVLYRALFRPRQQVHHGVDVRCEMTKDIIVKAVDVTKLYGPFTALDKVNLEIAKGEVCCIIGPSGSGKSTFLRCINQLEKMNSGAIWVNDELVGYRREGNNLHEINDADMARQRRRVGMVFQRFNLFPHMTALENVMEGPVQVLKEPVAEVRKRAEDILVRVGLSDKIGHYPSQLSGGQQQRVAIARAMCMRPDLILFDEPTSALDPELVSEVLDVMKDLAASGMTMIVVTHELGFARNVANTVAFMEAGKMVEIGPASEVLTSPKSPRTAEFIRAVHS